MMWLSNLQYVDLSKHLLHGPASSWKLSSVLEHQLSQGSETMAKCQIQFASVI